MADGEWRLWACGEYCGVMPDGRIKPADVCDPGHWRAEAGGCVDLSGPRNGWLSLQVIVQGRGEFAIRCEAGDDIECDLFREFYHRLVIEGEPEAWLPDALVPVANGVTLAIPAPDNECPQQTTQAVWMDLFVRPDAAPGVRSGRVTVSAGGGELTLELAIDVLDVSYPDEDCILPDHNSYGHQWMAGQYPALPADEGPAKWEQVIDLAHKYHAMCFEHHGLLHQLGHTHFGQVGEIYRPGLTGDGRNKHAGDWTWFDRHYGPLLDGSAFAGGRRKAQPLPTMYTGFNPGWPADYVAWGQPGYDVELVNVLRDHDAHLRERGWTGTTQEFFFNHKKRYRGFPWDGDEPRFRTTDAYWKKYRALLDEAVGDSPIDWRLRMDASWLIREHSRDLAGVVDFWVMSTWADFWPREITEGPMARGEMVWSYGPTVAIQERSAKLVQFIYRTWVRGFGGFERWLHVGVPPDPWLASDGSPLGWLYPGARFGVDGPIASIRLKIERNATQDINLMDQAARARGVEQCKAAWIERIPLTLWREPTPIMLEKPPHLWTNADTRHPDEAGDPRMQEVAPRWWEPIRKRVQADAAEVQHG